MWPAPSLLQNGNENGLVVVRLVLGFKCVVEVVVVLTQLVLFLLQRVSDDTTGAA